MAMVVPLAAAGAETAAGSAAAAGAGAAGRGAAGKAASRGAAKSGAAKSSTAAAAAPAAAPTGGGAKPRRSSAERYDARQKSGTGSTAVTPATEESQTLGEQLDAPSQAVDDAVKNSRAYVAAQKARPSQQVAGGLLAAIVIYPVLLNFLKGGSPQVKRWFRAKAFNITSTPGAASTVSKASYVTAANTTGTGLSSGTGSTGPPATSAGVSGAAGTAIAFARSKIGIDYLWGGDGGKSGNGGYDCSGLTSKAYAAAGIAIGRTTLQQIFAGRGVSKAELQPGDLVFAHPRHVAIYTGNGNIVEAPRTGLKVREVPMWGFWRARRVT